MLLRYTYEVSYFLDGIPQTYFWFYYQSRLLLEDSQEFVFDQWKGLRAKGIQNKTIGDIYFVGNEEI